MPDLVVEINYKNQHLDMVVWWLFGNFFMMVQYLIYVGFFSIALELEAVGPHWFKKGFINQEFDIQRGMFVV